MQVCTCAIRWLSPRWLVMALVCCPVALGADFVPTAQDRIVPAGAKVEVLWRDGEFTEGPAASPRDGSIYFTDIGNRILRYDPENGQVTVYRQSSGKANGLMFDGLNRLYACEGANGGNRRVSITGPRGKIRSVAEDYDGRRFNSPNDLYVDARRRVWFTDPRYVGNEPLELDFAGVYLIGADESLTLATRELKAPNGILVSPSLDRLYVAESEGSPQGNHQLVAFAVGKDGSLSGKQVLFDFGTGRRGIDGMALDKAGNIYGAAGEGDLSGIYVFSPSGKPLARISLPGAPTNCEFGLAGDARSLYITGALSGEAKGPAKGAYGLMRIKLANEGFYPFSMQNRAARQ